MVEHTQAVSDDMIEVLRAVAPFENVIQRGDDVRRGEVVLMKGRRLRPQDIGALAGLGMTKVVVFRKPVVSIIATGDEIVPAGSTPGPGQVRDINSYTLAGLIAEHGGIPVRKGIISDRSDDIGAVIGQSLRDSDIVLVGGGTSAGTKDMTARIINDAGRPGVLFHGASLKPGKPVIGGIVSGKPIFGLPGHPAAIFVCFDLFIRPLLDRWGGAEERLRVSVEVTAAMAKSVASAAGREDHVRVALEERDGILVAVPVLGKSGLITTLVKADGIVVIPPAKLGVDEGETVRVRLF
jgi:molybdopterin molybdotransferase